MNLASLPCATKDLILLMQTIQFGRIENLRIRDCEPQLRECQLTRTRKFDESASLLPALPTKDFQLKAQHIEFLNTLKSVKDGTLTLVVIRHGLPCFAEESVSTSILR